VAPKIATGSVEEAQDVLEFSGFRKDEEGWVDGNTNRNIAKQRVGKHYIMLHFLFLDQSIC
jgi:hypothetical protein